MQQVRGHPVSDRHVIQDAITDWRDGATFDAVHALESDDLTASPAFLWNDNAVKDLARVIAARLRGEEVTRRKLPWS